MYIIKNIWKIYEKLDGTAESNHTNAASEGKNGNNNTNQQLSVKEKAKKKEEEKKVREIIKKRNIDENFNFFESYFVLKQETNYRLHSQQHYSGKLGLKNISRLQLLRLISNIVTRKEDLSSIIPHSVLIQILRAVFYSKLNGKKFQNISYDRFKLMLNMNEDLEKETNLSFKIYNNIKKYFEKMVKKYDGAQRNFHTEDVEHYYQGMI